MDVTSLILGVAAIGFGNYTLYLRKNAPQKLMKLDPMKKFWGEKRGNIMHLVAYVVAPIVFGLLFLSKVVF